ncbi:hypothetical protein P8452_38712 [Trifolium repens]|nr:hypothetical protein P8452_38712 [Trifolium repens]
MAQEKLNKLKKEVFIIAIGILLSTERMLNRFLLVLGVNLGTGVRVDTFRNEIHLEIHSHSLEKDKRECCR